MVLESLRYSLDRMLYYSCICVDSVMLLLAFLFFKLKTAYEMRISDWSSDVCSSDLAHCRAGGARNARAAIRRGPPKRRGARACARGASRGERRSEESSVGKECVMTRRSRWSPDSEKLTD